MLKPKNHKKPKNQILKNRVYKNCVINRPTSAQLRVIYKR